MDFFTIRAMCCNFLNLYGRYVLQYNSFLTVFSLQTQQIEVRLVAIKSAFLSHYAYTPFHFSRTLPLSLQMLFEPAPGRITILKPSIYIPSSQMLFEPALGRILILKPSTYILSLQMLFEPAPGRILILNPSIYIPSSQMLWFY